MSEASDPYVLGLVPVVGRETLAFLAYKGSALMSCAVEALCPLADRVMVVAADGQAEESRDALAQLDSHTESSPPGPGIGSLSGAVDVVELPRDESLIRTAAAGADVVVIHDPLCPGVSAASMRWLVEFWSPGTVMVAVRPVVDTVKVVDDGVVAGTLNREGLRMISSPLVMPADRIVAMPQLGERLADLASLVATLRGAGEMVLVVADPSSGRVQDPSSVALLEALDAVHERDR
jgi:2-C-methyl-D-erythritol 4-phosphate cytidylyltransferase